MDFSVWSYVAFGAVVLFIGWRVFVAKNRANKPGGHRPGGEKR